MKYPKLAPGIEEALIQLLKAQKVPVQFNNDFGGSILWSDENGKVSDYEVPWPTTEIRALIVLHEYAHSLDTIRDFPLYQAYRDMDTDKPVKPKDYIRILACEVRAWRVVTQLVKQRGWAFSTDAWVWIIIKGLRSYWALWTDYNMKFPTQAMNWTISLFQDIEKVAPGFSQDDRIKTFFNDYIIKIEPQNELDEGTVRLNLVDPETSVHGLPGLSLSSSS